MNNKCFIPISVGSDLFRTRAFLPALRPLLNQYLEFVFLVADQIQLYNKVSCVHSPSDFIKVLNNFRSKSRYLEERRVWLNRIFQGLKRESYQVQEWSVLGVDDLLDRTFYHIYKAVLLMFETIKTFRLDILGAARSHVARYAGIPDHKRQIRLAICYLLEEIAINLRLHVCERIFHEYYVGENLLPLIKLYHGVYEITVDELTGYPPSPEPFRFYQYVTTPDGSLWKLINQACHYQ